MNIVVAYCERWDTPLRTSKHHFIERMAKNGHRILYVDTPPSILTLLRRPLYFIRSVLPRIFKSPKKINNNLWTMTGFSPFPYHKACFGVFDHLVFNRLNQKFFLWKLKGALKELSFVDPNLIVYLPLMAPALEQIKWRCILFHMVDEWQGLPRIPKTMALLTKEMLQKSDVTVVTSQRLYDRYSPFSQNIHLLRHGTDIALFRPVVDFEIEEDDRLKNLPKPRVGYYGALHKLDFELVDSVARARPAWSFIFMGPIKGPQGFNLPNDLPRNVCFFEPIERNKLPNFLVGIDVFWMPYLINELNHSMCSIKIYEVLSAGLPLVISDLDESRAVLQAQGSIARTANEHCTQIEYSLEMNHLEHRLKRAEFVKNCDWTQKTQRFLEYLES